MRNDPALAVIGHFRRDDAVRDLVTRDFCIRAATLNDQARSVDVVLSTETPAQVYDWGSDRVVTEILRADGCQIPADGMVMLADHERWSITAIRGSVRNMRVEAAGGARQVVGTLVFANDPDSQRAYDLVKGGHLRAVSVGYRVLAHVDLAAGESRSIDGVDYTAGANGLRVSTRWAPYEGSLVPVGADPGAKIRARLRPADSATSVSTEPASTRGPAADPKDSAMTFAQWCAARGLDETKLTAAQRALLEADFAAFQRAQSAPSVTAPPAPPAAPAAPATAPAGDEAIRAEGMKAERARVAAIRTAGDGIDDTLVNRAISEGWSVEQANREFLTALRAARGTGQTGGVTGVSVEVVRAASDKFAEAVGDQFLLRNGLARHVPEERRKTNNGLGYLTLQGLARTVLRREHIEATENPDELFRRSLSTYSFPQALGNVVNRTLAAAYEDYPSTALQFAQPLDCKDFREHKFIKIGRFGRPEKTGKGGAIKAGFLQEEAEGYTVDTVTQLMVITRQDFINDDLSLFSRMPMALGTSMKVNIDETLFALLISGANSLGPTLDADSKQLFDTAHVDVDAKFAAVSNVISGAGSVLSSTSLTTARQTMRKITQNGRAINVEPKYLVVPPELEQTALELVNSVTIIAGGDTSVGVRGSANVHFNKLEVIVDPRLSSATNGTTAWYLFADYVRAAHVAVCFLAGARNPTIERRDPTDVLGLGWLGYHDIGADAVDWRGCVRTKGAV